MMTRRLRRADDSCDPNLFDKLVINVKEELEGRSSPEGDSQLYMELEEAMKEGCQPPPDALRYILQLANIHSH